MRRLSAIRIFIAGLALLACGALAGCSSGQGLAYADGASAGSAQSAAPAVTATVPAVPATPATARPAAGDLEVAGAPQGVLAKAGVLADATTGQVLWNEGMDTERPIASITKVMTAYLIISAGDVDREIAIPQGVVSYEVKYGASSDGLKPGEVYTVRQLLYGLLLESGADAAYTLATVYGPGIPAFLAKMNATAQHLGMLHTHFTSPDGLPYPTEASTYSTPADLLTLGEMAMKSSLFASIVDQRSYTVPAGDGHAQHTWENSNELIGSYDGAVGIKTGFTNGALHCLLFEAVRNGRTLIGVVLGSPATGPGSGAADAARVLNWGFSLKEQG